MLLLGFLLLPVILTVGGHRQLGEYGLRITGGTLQKVNRTAIEELNLSNFGLKAIDGNVFPHFTNLKILNLANNSIQYFSKDTFGSLTKLEHLDLSNNSLDSGNFYDGLSNLKTLNIANNPVTYFSTGFFFGLSTKVQIWTEGLSLKSITPTIFKSNRMRRSPKDGENGSVPARDENETYARKQQSINDGHSVIVCIRDHHLESMENFNKTINLTEVCKSYEVKDRTLNLEQLSIRTFESGWYRLKNHIVHKLWFNHNEIVRITKEILNDLPSQIVKVHLRNNGIKRLEGGVFQNESPIQVLDLSFNHIREIEDDALEKLSRIDTLILEGNQLNNTKFLRPLPSNILRLRLNSNQISKISVGDFSNLANLHSLDLSSNKITTGNANALNGLSSLVTLNLANNSLRNIEQDFFQGLKKLIFLDLSQNKISNLSNGVFSDLEKLLSLDLSSNELTNIDIGVFKKLPNSLYDLDLSHNRIKSLRVGTFVHGLMYLLLNDNEISNIENGSIDLPNLIHLDLRNNNLNKIDGDVFERTKYLRRLFLNANNVTKLEKGFAKHLNNLSYMNLSQNLFESLENGVFWGLPEQEYTTIELKEVPVKMIQGGLFDE